MTPRSSPRNIPSCLSFVSTFPVGPEAPEDPRTRSAQIVYEAMTQALNVPQDDRFLVLAEHAASDLVDRSDLPWHLALGGCHHHPDHPQRRVADVAIKQAFYKAVADGAPRREIGNAPGRRFHQPRRGEEGKLVVRQRCGAIRLKDQPMSQSRGHNACRLASAAVVLRLDRRCHHFRGAAHRRRHPRDTERAHRPARTRIRLVRPPRSARPWRSTSCSMASWARSPSRSWSASACAGPSAARSTLLGIGVGLTVA